MSDSEEPPEALPLHGDDAPLPPLPGSAATAEPAAPRAPVPVTLITGFLGAGKTTLVRHILTARHGRRIAVILNEFGGEGDIERAFVRGEGGETAAVPQWALEALVAPDSAHAGKFDAVLIETTGLANPGPIIGELWSDEELEPAVSLDGVVAVVDAANVARQLAEARAGGAANEAQLQVAMADVVLVNKVDLVSEQHLEAVEARLRAINATARLVRCERSAVDPAALFGCGGYRLRDASGAPLLAGGGNGAGAPGVATGWGALAAAEASECTGGGACSDPSHDHSHHARGSSGGAMGSAVDPCASHDASIRTVALRCEVPVSIAKFTAWLEALLWAATVGGHAQGQVQAGGGSGSSSVGGGGGGSSPGVASGGSSGIGGGGSGEPEVLRLKGLLDVAGKGNAHMVQAVYEVYDIVEGPSWPQMEAQWAEEARQRSGTASPARGTRLVVIGRRLDKDALQRGLETCAA